MTIRYYILPIVVYNGVRGPAYFSGWPMGPDKHPGINCQWSMKDYGSINEAVLCADILAADHTALIVNTDVLAIPINIDSTLTVSARNAARTFLETYNVPAGWVNTGMTYRSVLRTVTGFFLFFQRVTAVLGRDINLPAGWLDIQIQNVAADIRAALQQAATEAGYDYSAVQPTTTMRIILKALADNWGNAPIYFGIATL
jgi:hypothetical protein